MNTRILFIVITAVLGLVLISSGFAVSNYIRNQLYSNLISQYGNMGNATNTAHTLPVDSSSAVVDASKDKAAGVFCLLAGNTAKDPYVGYGGGSNAHNLSAIPCFSSPDVQGIVLRTTWDMIEHAKGTFDWSFIDQGIALALKNGKSVSLEIDAGIDSPSWVYTDGALQMTIQSYPMPVPWDSTYISDWSIFVQAMAARYDGSPTLAYITMTGPGRHDEVYVATNQADMDAFNTAGGGDPAKALSDWEAGAEKIIDVYGKAFVKTPFVLAAGLPVTGSSGPNALLDIENYGFTTYGNFGIASHGLYPSTLASNPGPLLIKEYTSTDRPVGYQMFLPFLDNKDVKGTIGDALNIGIATGGHFIEVYEKDVDDAANAAVLQAANAQLLKSF